MASDHSVTVRGSRWYDHAQEKGGGPVGFVQTFYGLSYPEAVSLLLGGEQGQAYPAARPEPERQKAPFALPPPAQSTRRIFAYLTKTRRIAPEVLRPFLRRGLIYEDAAHHNAVFVGHDEAGTARYAMLRSTASNSGFKIEQAGSDKSCGFCMKGSGQTLYVCEAAIDALSVATLRKLGGRDWRKGSYLSLGGVTASEEILPPALERQLKNFPFKRVVLALDNDDKGQRASQNIFRMLKERHPEIELKVCVPQEKDFNDQLRIKRQQKGQPPPSRGTREIALTN